MSRNCYFQASGQNSDTAVRFGDPHMVRILWRSWAIVQIFAMKDTIHRGMLRSSEAIQTNIGVVSADVWITTGGTMCNDMARFVGEAVRACVEQSANTDLKLVLIGFANLLDITDNDGIRQHSYAITPVRVVHVLCCLSNAMYCTRH